MRKIEDVQGLRHESVSQTIGFVQLRCPAAAPPVLVDYQSVSFNPHREIIISVEWKSAVFDQILGQVYRVTWAHAVYLCLCVCYHVISTNACGGRRLIAFSTVVVSVLGVVLLYSAKTGLLRELSPSVC